MRAEVWSAPSPHGTRNSTEEQGPHGMGGCPRLIVCLLFKDDDDNHGYDDDRRNLSPSASHYVSNLQDTTVGDGGRLRRRTSRFLPHFRSFNPAIDSERVVERAEGMSFFCVFSTLCRIEVN